MIFTCLLQVWILQGWMLLSKPVTPIGNWAHLTGKRLNLIGNRAHLTRNHEKPTGKSSIPIGNWANLTGKRADLIGNRENQLEKAPSL